MELLVKRAWYRTLAKITGRAYPRTPTTSAARLPLEIVEIIVTYLSYDTPSILACSLTCYHWYIAAVPHLHQTLTIVTTPWKSGETVWPKPLRRMHRLGLLPLVQELLVYNESHNKFTPKRFDSRTLHYFFTLTKVRHLGIHNLDIPRFTPRIQRYFKNLLPTLRSLALKDPRGSNRQIIHFIGLFQHLEDLTLRYERSWEYRQEPSGTSTPAPPFSPPLRGRLMMKFISGTDLLKDMVRLFGGIRFHSLDLSNVEGVWLWIDACAETLEILRLYPDGERPPLKGVQVLTISQLGPPSQASICRGTGCFGRSSSERRRVSSISFTMGPGLSHRTPCTYSRPSYPPHPSRSLSFIGTTTSAVYNPMGLCDVCHKLTKRWRPHIVVRNSGHSGRSTKCGTFGWCCAQTFGMMWGSTRCKRWKRAWQWQRQGGCLMIFSLNRW